MRNVLLLLLLLLLVTSVSIVHSWGCKRIEAR